MLEVDIPAHRYIWCALGVDPNGGTDPLSESVIYAPQNWTEDTWQKQEIEVTAQGEWMTVFIRSRTAVSGGWQWCHVDDVSVAPLAKTPTPSPIKESPNIQMR
jgi:hypothetical protein